jgi:3-(3-hydroxy-phenyl)propionate hydroxylase
MGQGMCAGIRDAANLAWKLADVLAGDAHDALLDTYESERSPHVREFIETAVRLGAVIRSGNAPATAAHGEPQRFATPQPRLGPGAHDGSAAAACVAEQPSVAGTLLDDLAGYREVLLTERATASDAKDLGTDVPIILAEEGGAAADWLGRLDARAVLIRPDRYVAGVARDAAGLKKLLTTYAQKAGRAGA